jgi:hypothetical protein
MRIRVDRQVHWTRLYKGDLLGMNRERAARFRAPRTITPFQQIPRLVRLLRTAHSR